MCQYLKDNTRLPSYYPLPRELLSLELSMTARVVYAVLLGRATLSQKNGWNNEYGYVYIIYPINQIAKDIGKGQTTVKKVLKELVNMNLLERKSGGYSKPNYLYVKVPIESVSSTFESRNTDGMEVRKATTNYYNKTNNKNKYTYKNQAFDYDDIEEGDSL